MHLHGPAVYIHKGFSQRRIANGLFREEPKTARIVCHVIRAPSSASTRSETPRHLFQPPSFQSEHSYLKQNPSHNSPHRSSLHYFPKPHIDPVYCHRVRQRESLHGYPRSGTESKNQHTHRRRSLLHSFRQGHNRSTSRMNTLHQVRPGSFPPCIRLTLHQQPRRRAERNCLKTSNSPQSPNIRPRPGSQPYSRTMYNRSTCNRSTLRRTAMSCLK